MCRIYVHRYVGGVNWTCIWSRLTKFDIYGLLKFDMEVDICSISSSTKVKETGVAEVNSSARIC